MRIDHVAMWSNDIEKQKDFYVKYFRCTAGGKYENNSRRFSSYFLTFTGGARLEIMQRKNVSKKASEDTTGLAHLAIQVGTREKVDDVTKRLEKDGYIIKSRPRVTGDGYYESVVLDPEGNAVELTATDEYTITEAQYEDLADILYLQKCCYLSEAESYQNYTIPPLTQTLEDIRKDCEKHTILKLEVNNKIIGSVRAYVENDTCYIGRLIVDADFQNRGFGKLLLESVERTFNSVKRYELFTGSKSAKNLYLYHKLGYRECKEKHMQGITIKYLEKYTARLKEFLLIIYLCGRQLY